MAFVRPKDRVLEHSTTSGTGPYALAGAVDTSYYPFSQYMANGDTTLGAIIEPGVAFASGLLTYSTTTGITLTTTYESKGTFGSGTKEIMMGLPASRAVYLDRANAFTSDVSVGGNFSVSGTSALAALTAAAIGASGAISTTDTTASTSTTTGSGRFAGGLGVGGAINAGGAINVGGGFVSIANGATNDPGTALQLQNTGMTGSPNLYMGMNTGNVAAVFQISKQSGTPSYGYLWYTLNAGVQLAAMSLNGPGTLRLHAYGAGTLTTDGSGNVTASSDATLKVIRGPFKRGIADLRGVRPILHSWTKESGMETKGIYAGFSAQNVQRHIPEIIGRGRDGKLTFQDRGMLATLVNTVLSLDEEIAALKSRLPAA